MQRFLIISVLIAVIRVTTAEHDFENEIDRMVRTYEYMVEEIGPYINHNFGVPEVPPPVLRETYDFIVVGSGSTGSVIANRLSEVKRWNVLLIEAGEEATIFTDIPAIAPVFQFTDYNWGYVMEKQDNFSLGMNDGRMAWPRGKAVGGSSILSNMIHTRGNKFDYDRWEALGNPGWSYDDVLPYFMKSEDSSVLIQDKPFRGNGGYLSVQDVSYRTESVHAFINAAQEVGHEYVDYNGGNQLGVSYVQATAKQGMRCSGEKAFLRSIRYRPNLTILTKSFVTKVLINPDTRRAYGVEYVRNGKNRTAEASKEVILSAGVFNSPQLLILSGVGPREDLEELGIPLVYGLPVGQKLYDHVVFLGLTFILNQPVVYPLLHNLIEDPEKFLQVFFDRSGPLAALTGVEAVSFLKTNASNYTEDYPDIELIFTTSSFQLFFGVNDNIYNRIWKPLEEAPVVSIFPVLLHPKSFGNIQVRSTDPLRQPQLFGKFFTDIDDQDLKTLLAAIREVQRIAKAPSLRRYGARQVKTPIPGCQNHPFDSDPYWVCALRHLTTTFHHPTSTCKMGPSSDNEAVVDSKLRVYGIKQLRVADTSVIPISLSGDTNVPAVMIGEKAADLIKEDWLTIEASLIESKYIRRSVSYT